MRKRQFKKVLSLVLALAMVFSMNTSVFATADVTVPAAETQTEAQPETPVTNETETPAPAETPAEAEPAAEAAPADEAAPAPEAAPEEEAPAKAEEAAPVAPAAEASDKEDAAGVSGDAVSVKNGIKFGFAGDGNSAVEGENENTVIVSGNGTIAGTADNGTNTTILLSENAVLTINAIDGTGTITIREKEAGYNTKIVVSREVNVANIITATADSLEIQAPTTPNHVAAVSVGEAKYYYLSGEEGTNLSAIEEKTISSKDSTAVADAATYTISYADATITAKEGYKVVLSNNALAVSADIVAGTGRSNSNVWFDGKAIIVDSATGLEAKTVAIAAKPGAPSGIAFVSTKAAVTGSAVKVEFDNTVADCEYVVTSQDEEPTSGWKNLTFEGKFAELEGIVEGTNYLWYRTKATDSAFASAVNKATGTLTGYIKTPSPWTTQGVPGDLKVTDGILMVSNNDPGVFLISANSKTATTHKLYNSGSTVAIKKVYISENDTYNPTIYVSGNGLSVKTNVVGKWNDSDSSLTDDSGKKLATEAGKVEYKTDKTYAVTKAAEYNAESVIYEGRSLAKGSGYTLSYNGNTISFDGLKADEKAYVVSVGNAETSVEVVKDGNYSNDLIEFINAGAESIWIAYPDGSIGYNSDDIANYGTVDLDTLINGFEASSNGVKITLKSTGGYYALSENGEAAPDPTKDAGWTKAETTTLEFSNKKPETTYTIVVRAGGVDTSTFRSVVDGGNTYTFTTKAKAVADNWEDSNDWYAYKKGVPGTIYKVSTNKTEAGALLVDKEIGDAAEIILVASSNKASKINRVFISGDSVSDTAKVILSSNTSGVEIENEKVIRSKDLKVLNPLYCQDGSVIKNKDGVSYAGEGELLKDEKVYLPVVLEKDKDFTVSYDSVTVALSGDRAGKAVLVGTKAVSIDMVNNKKGADKDSTPADDLIGTDSIVIESTEVNIGYYVIEGGLGTYAKTPVVEAPETYKSDFFNVKTEAGVKYAFSTVSYSAAERRDLSFKTYANGAKIVSYNNAAKNEDVKKLTGGQTYYIYAMAEANVAAQEFANYSQSNQVTLGVSIDFIAKPVVETHMIDSTVSFGDIKLAADPVTYDKGSEKATVSDADLAKAYNLADFQYGVSLNGWNDNKESLVKSGTDSAKLTKGKTDYTVKAAENFKPDETAKNSDFNEHNDTTLKINNNTFYVMSTNSTLEVTPGTFYYAQNEDALIKNALAVADGKGKVPESSLDVQIGTVSGDKFTPDTKIDIKTLSAGSTFGAHFFIKGATDVSTNKTITVEKRPVVLTAKQNYFSLRHKDLVSANKIDPAYLVVEDKGDIYETPQAELLKKYFSGDVKPKFGSDINKDLISDNAYHYGLSFKTTAAVTSGNYVVSSGNAEGFGYYVLPVYDVTFTGKFESASFNGAAIKTGDKVTVSSAAAAKKAEYEAAANKPVTDYDITAAIVVPSNVIAKKGSKFIEWKRVEGTKKVEVSANEKIKADTTYDASTRDGVPGFTSSENGLMIEFSDEVGFTGKKHVTNPDDFSDFKGKNGAEAALETMQQTANAGSGDVTLKVFIGDRQLLEGLDYKAVYKNNVNAYDAKNTSQAKYASKAPQVTITFKGAYASYPTVVKYFTIKQVDIEKDLGGDVLIGNYTEFEYYAVDTKGSNVKTGLVNDKTGAALVANKNGKKDLIITAPAKIREGDNVITIKGTNNYKGEVTVAVTGIAKANFKTVTLNTKAKTALDFTAENAFTTAIEQLPEAFNEAARKNKTLKNLSVTYDDLENRCWGPVKGADYVVPGNKKATYSGVIIKDDKYYAVKGNFQFTINKAEAGDFEFTFDEVPEGGVPYVKTGATLGYTVTFKGQEFDTLSKVVKVKYSSNKKVGGTAKATPAAVKASYVNQKSTKLSAQAKSFTVGKATLTEENVTLKYVIPTDIKDTPAKTQAAIAKSKSIVVRDDFGNVLKPKTDYTITLGTKNEAANGNATYQLIIEGAGKNYQGKLEHLEAVEVNPFLAKLTIKMTAQNFSKSDMEAIASGNVSEVVKTAGIKVYNGKNEVGTYGEDYEIVISPAASGAYAFVQAVGIDGGKLGGSDVFAKKQLKKKVQ